ncbi:MAG: GBS Bsp-like repeat-containing protein, partial [Clostridia bacterium]|nr:GBS Bsp-like repeat-containing protein [Clostridia bacterium]
MSRRNGMIVKKIRNIVILLMAIIVMIGAYKNIGDSRAEDVIEIEAIAIDNYGYLENEIFKLEAIQIDDETYEIQLPESINGKEINQIVKITLEEPVPEVESEGAVQENASTENAVEGVAEENPLTEQTPTENATTSEENKEQVAETPDQQESTEQTPVEQTPTEKPTTSEENKEQTPETPVEELVGEQTPETPVEDFTGEQTPVEGEPTDQIPTEKNAIEIIDNKIRLTKEQIENKQLNIEVVYYVVILEKDEQGELVKNLLSGEGITGENSPIEITEETETLYGKILKYEDEENGKLVEVKGYLPKDAELKVEEVAQEQLVEIFGEKRIDVAYDIKIVINITKEVLVDETDPSKGTTEVLETIEINPEEFGEICQVLIKDANIQTESQVYHVKEDNTYEKVNVKENTKENITFDAQTFSIYAVTNDEDVMLTAGTEGSDQILISPEYKTSNSTINVDVTTIGWEMPDYYAWSTSTSESVASSSKVAMTGSTSADTWTVSISTPGTWYLHIWYGYEYAYSGPYLIDKSKPTCTIVDYDGSWTTANPLIVTLSGTDSGGAGISYYQWRFENASWATLQNSYNKAYHYDEQEQIVYYRCVDAAGNASEPVSVMLRMDRTAPTNLAVSNSGGGNWTNQDVTLTASATDNLSGVEKYQWSSDNSTWNDMSGSSVTFTETMNSTIYVRALDYAGNTSSTVSTEVKIDKIAPEGNITTSATLINGVYYTNQPTVTIYVNAWDTGGSDIQTLWLGAYYNPPYVNYVTNFGLTWDSTNNRFYANISLNDIVNTSTNQTNQGDGYYSIDLSILDNAGNGGWINAVHVVYDTTPPTATSAEIKNVSNTGYDVYVHGVSDNLSGVNRIQFPTWTDSGWQDDLAGNWVTNSAVSGTNLGNGTWYFRVNVSDHNYEEGWYNTHIYMYDNIENVRYISELITGDDEDDGRVFVDRTAPTLTVSPSSCDWRNSALSVTITATDPTVNGGSSGLSTSNSYQYFLSTSDSPTATGTLSNYTSGTAFDINPGTSGQYYLYVRQISDNATNTSSTSNQ